MATATDNALVFDLRQFTANSRVRRNILSIRSSVSQDKGYVDIQTFTLGAGESITLPNLPACLSITISSERNVVVTGTVPGMPTTTTWPAQPLFISTSGLDDVFIANNNTSSTVVNVIRLSETVVQYAISRRLVTFDAFERIAAIGTAITSLANVVVTDTSYQALTNDQVSAPSVTAIGKFRICDSDGTPNVTGAYIMYLDDNVTQINSSGTLQLWVGQLA